MIICSLMVVILAIPLEYFPILRHVLENQIIIEVIVLVLQKVRLFQVEAFKGKAYISLATNS